MYFIIFYCIPLLLLAWLADKNAKSKGGYIFKTFLILFISIISVFTAPVAIDHEDYVHMFDPIGFYSIKDLGFSFIGTSRNIQVESGYMLINWILAHVGVAEPYFFLIIALVINTAIISFAYKHRYPIFTIAYIFIGGQILINEQNLVRQFLASSIFLFAIYYLENHQRLKYLLLIFLASLIHVSAIVLAFFVLCDDNEKKGLLSSHNTGRRGQYVVSLLYIFSIVSIVFPAIIQNILFSSLFDYYAIYQNAEKGIGMSTPIVYLFFYNIFAILAIVFWGKTSKVLAANAIAMAVVYNFSLSVPNALRLQAYFLVPTVVFIFHSVLSNHKGQSLLLGKEVTKVSLFIVGVYLLESAFNNFVFTKTLLLSETYKIEDFLSIF